MGTRGRLNRLAGLMERACVVVGLTWVALVSLQLLQSPRL